MLQIQLSWLAASPLDERNPFGAHWDLRSWLFTPKGRGRATRPRAPNYSLLTNEQREKCQWVIPRDSASPQQLPPEQSLAVGLHTGRREAVTTGPSERGCSGGRNRVLPSERSHSERGAVSTGHFPGCAPQPVTVNC